MSDSPPEQLPPSEPPPSEPPPSEPLPSEPLPKRRPPNRYLRLVERFVVDFFGAPTTGESAALFRIAYGILACWGAIGVWLNLERYYTDRGIVPFEIVQGDSYEWISAFYWAPHSIALAYVHAVIFTVAAVLFTVGFFPRVMAFLICYVNISLQFRNPFLLNSGDRLFQIAAGLATMMPLGRRWSFDAWRRAAKKLGPAPTVAIYGQRLMQLELAYVYLSSGISKLANERWRQGIALRDVLSSPVFSEWPHYYDLVPIVAVLTWGTILFEVGFPLVVWFKKARPWALLAGIGFHVGIDSLMIIPIFSAIMLACYPLYLEDQEATSLVSWVRRRFGRDRIVLDRSVRE